MRETRVHLDLERK